MCIVCYDDVVFLHESIRVHCSLRYTFYDGPPFATGLPHYGHILAGTIKVSVCVYMCVCVHVCVRTCVCVCARAQLEQCIRILWNQILTPIRYVL